MHGTGTVGDRVRACRPRPVPCPSPGTVNGPANESCRGGGSGWIERPGILSRTKVPEVPASFPCLRRRCHIPDTISRISPVVFAPAHGGKTGYPSGTKPLPLTGEAGIPSSVRAPGKSADPRWNPDPDPVAERPRTAIPVLTLPVLPGFVGKAPPPRLCGDRTHISREPPDRTGNPHILSSCPLFRIRYGLVHPSRRPVLRKCHTLGFFRESAKNPLRGGGGLQVGSRGDSVPRRKTQCPRTEI